MIQHRNQSFDSFESVRGWWWSQWWKIFPMYWLAIASTVISAYIDGTEYYSDAGNILLNVLGLQTLSWSITTQGYFNLVFWFVGTMWIVYLAFPLLLPLVKRAAPRTNRYVAGACLMTTLVI